MQNTEAMLAFYRSLGLEVVENANACSVYVGGQMINFHRPAHWQDVTFTLRAPAAKPPCGDLCFVWEGTPESVKAMLDRAGVAEYLDVPFVSMVNLPLNREPAVPPPFVPWRFSDTRWARWRNRLGYRTFDWLL
jgi:hypothetical protein